MKRIAVIFFAMLMCITLLVSCSNEPYPYELDKYIKLAELPTDLTFTEEEILERVDEKILEVRQNNAVKTLNNDKAAENGDMVNVSFVCYPAATYGKEDSKPIQKISDPDCTITIGNNKYPIELEKAIIGMFPSDKTTARLTYPQNFALKEYAGMSVVFEITLNSVTEVRLPLYNDAFVRTVSICQTVDEYETFIFERVKEDIVWEYMLKNSEVLLYPTEELNEYSSDFSSYYSGLATEKDITLEEYVSKKFFIELSEFHIKTDSYAKDMVKGDLLLYSLVNKYGLQLSDEQYTAGAERYATQYGFRSVSLLEGKFGSDFVRKSVQQDEVLKYLSQNGIKVIPSEAQSA